MVGALGLGLYQVLWSLGLSLTAPSNSALILSTQPFLGLFMSICLKRALGKQQYWGMLLALVGVVLVILKPTPNFIFHWKPYLVIY